AEGAELAGEEEGEEAQAGKGEGGVAGGEGSPAVLEDPAVRGGADGYVNWFGGCGGGGGNTAREKVWTRPTNGVLEDVGEELREGDRDEESEVSGFVLSGRRACEEIDQQQDAQRHK
ncbi:unnamed protein product, partial [Clonostachys rosea]